MKTSFAITACLCALTARAQDSSSMGDMSAMDMRSSGASAGGSASVRPSGLSGLGETAAASGYSVPLSTGTSSSSSNSLDNMMGSSSNGTSSSPSFGLSGSSSSGSSGSSSSGSSSSASSGSASGCQDSHASFNIFADFDSASINVKRNWLFARQSPSEPSNTLDSLPAAGHSCGSFYLSLSSSNLTDQANRTCEITSNYQYQCDINGGQYNAITKTGFAVCNDNEMGVNGQTDWWFCKTRDPIDGHEFWNIYEAGLQVEGVEGGVPKQCTKGKLRAVECALDASSQQTTTPEGSGGVAPLGGTSSISGGSSSVETASPSATGSPSGSDLSLGGASSSGSGSGSSSGTGSTSSGSESSSSGPGSSSNSGSVSEVSRRGVKPWIEEEQKISKRSAFPFHKLGKVSWPVSRS